MSPANLIAIDVMLLYILLGPVVLFAVYVLFDYISFGNRTGSFGDDGQKDPVLWTCRETDDFLDRA